MSLREYLSTGSVYLLFTGAMGACTEPGIFSSTNPREEARKFSSYFDCNALKLPLQVYLDTMAAVQADGLEAGKAVVNAARESDPSIGGGADMIDLDVRRWLEGELDARMERWFDKSKQSIEQASTADEAIHGIDTLRSQLLLDGESLWSTLDPARDQGYSAIIPKGSREEELVLEMWERFPDMSPANRRDLSRKIHVRSQAIGQYISRLDKQLQGRPRCQKKTPAQVEALERLFDELDGEISIQNARHWAAELGLEKGEQIKTWFARERSKRGMPKSSLWEHVVDQHWGKVEREQARSAARFAPY
eukprot:tig00020616_g12256.t1